MLTVSSTRIESDTDWINNTWDGSQQMMEGMLATTHTGPDKQSYLVFNGTKPQRHRIHQRLQAPFRHISYPVTETDNPVLTDKVEGEPLPPPADPCRMMIISMKDQQATPVQGDILLTNMKGIDIISQPPAEEVEEAKILAKIISTSEPPSKRRKSTETETRESKKSNSVNSVTGELVSEIPKGHHTTTDTHQVMKKTEEINVYNEEIRRHENGSTCICS